MTQPNLTPEHYDAILEICSILNDPGLTRKVRRVLLRDDLKLPEATIDLLCPKEEAPSDY